MNKNLLLIWTVLLSILLAGCKPVSAPLIEPTVQAALDTPSPENAFIREEVFPEPGVTYQWAERGSASSEFSSPEWSANQAAGRPDSPGCGDYQFSWASAASDSIDTLVVEFSNLVYPLEIVIYESFNPDQVVKVEVLDPERGGFYAVLQKNPIQMDRSCPYELIVPIKGINFKTNAVRITVDQSQLGLGWNEIDAVQLVGKNTQP